MEERQKKHTFHFRCMSQDRFQIFSQVVRLVRCIKECCLSRNDSGSLISAMFLNRCLQGRTWNDTSTILRQLRGIGSAYVRVLAFRGVKTFEDLRHVQEHEVELWCNRSTPFGQNLLRELDQIPQYELTIAKESQAPPPLDVADALVDCVWISKGDLDHIQCDCQVTEC